MNTPHDIGVASQIGKYSDAVEAPVGSRWLAISGTSGLTPDGTIPPTFEEEATQAWSNACAALAKAGFDVGDLVKITQYLTNADDIATHATVRARFLGDARPASMLVVVPALVWPQMRIEIEASAAPSTEPQPIQSGALEGRVEVDRHAIRITELCISLAPERIPRRLVAFEAGGHDPGVQIVDLSGALTFEGEADLIAGLALPVGPEAPNDVLGVEHEAHPIRQKRVHMPLVGRLGDVEAQQAVEPDRRRHVRRDDPESIQSWHAQTLADGQLPLEPEDRS